MASPDVSDLSREELEDIAREYQEMQAEFDELQTTVELMETTLFELEDLLVGDWSTAIAQDELEAGSIFEAVHQQPDVDGIRDDLEEHRDNSAEKRATLNRKVNILADETGVELSNERLRGEDKIMLVLRHGASEVVDDVYPSHLRARELLANAGDWGTIVNDANGKRWTINAGDARSRLKDARDEHLTPQQVRRALEKIVEWASETRDATLTKTPDGENQLTLYIDGGGKDA